MAYSYQIAISDGYEQAYIATEAVEIKDYDGRWRQIKPFNTSLIHDEMGYFKLAEQPIVGGATENDKGIPVVEFYYTNGQRMVTLYTRGGLYMGLVGHGVIHTEKTALQDPKNSVDPRSCEPPLVYKVFPLAPDLRMVWAGMAFKTGGQLNAYGQESLVGFMVNAATEQQHYFIVENERWSPGFGGDVGAVLCVATGFKDLREMANLEIGGQGVSISLGYTLGTYLKLLKDCPKSLNLFENMPRVANGLKGVEVVASKGRSKQKDWTNWAKLLISDIEFDADRTLSFFEIPGSGVGLELTVCNTVGKVVSVGSHDEVCRYAAKSASAPSNGTSKYVRQISY